MNIRNEIKAQIVRAGYTKLQRQSIRYREVVELAEALGYELIWKRND